MREIKFRAWDKKRRKLSQSFGIFDIYRGRDESSVADLDDFEIEDEFILLQFTGLKDKNGKEIYEGDIVLGYGAYDDRRETPLEIKWSTHRGGWLCETNVKISLSAYETGTWINPETVILEIVGNIYENPELLKQ